MLPRATGPRHLGVFILGIAGWIAMVALALGALAELPLWSRSSGMSSFHESGGCSFECVEEPATFWEAFDTDRDCPAEGPFDQKTVTALVVALGVLVLGIAGAIAARRS